MQRLRRLVGRDPLRLDDGTCERLLDGELPPDDAPPSYQRVAEVMIAATHAGTERELTGEVPAVASIIAHLDRNKERSTRRSSVHTQRRLLQGVTASLVGGVMLFGGMAAAGALPGAAQGIASDMLEKVGVSVPDPNDNSGTHSDVRGHSDDRHPPSTASGNGDGNPASSENDSTNSAPGTQGNDISDLARSTTATGAEKGAEISTLASDGKSQPGQPSAGANPPAGVPSTDVPPVEVPNRGGTTTADAASGGHSTAGTETANTNSDGHSEAGSSNASTGLGHKP
jgi:hypothetical protein